MNPYPLLRRLSHEHYTPGPQLAEALGVSRASVSLALKSASELGVQVLVQKSRGYRLAQPLSWLDETRVAQALGERARYFDLHCFDEIDSTNSALLAKIADGAPSGLCYAAERQTRGRGRRGRSWQGELGDSLMFSLLWRFNLGVADLSGLSLVVGLAVARALHGLGLKDAALKWPNDIIAPSGKLGGILIELAGDALGPSAVVIGIGLNVRLSDAQRTALDQPAESLAALGYVGERNALLATILAELAELLPRFEQQGFTAFIADWQACHALQNRPARLLLPNGTSVDGLVRGVAANGALQLEGPDGMQEWHSGEVSLRACSQSFHPSAGPEKGQAQGGRRRQ